MFSPNIKRSITYFVNLIFTYIVVKPILFGENGYFICSAYCALDKYKKKKRKTIEFKLQILIAPKLAFCKPLDRTR